MFVVRLTEADERRLEALAKATGQSRTFHAREAIQRYLEGFEGRAPSNVQHDARVPPGVQTPCVRQA